MRIDGLKPQITQPKPQPKADPVQVQQKQQAQAQHEHQTRMANQAKAKKAPIRLSEKASKEIMKNYADYYFKQGRQLESLKNYRQAISAYERSNIVEPAYSKGASMDGARNKLYGG